VVLESIFSVPPLRCSTAFANGSSSSEFVGVGEREHGRLRRSLGAAPCRALLPQRDGERGNGRT
jgi:hypothetical protein